MASGVAMERWTGSLLAELLFELRPGRQPFEYEFSTAGGGETRSAEASDTPNMQRSQNAMFGADVSELTERFTGRFQHRSGPRERAHCLDWRIVRSAEVKVVKTAV